MSVDPDKGTTVTEHGVRVTYKELPHFRLTGGSLATRAAGQAVHAYAVPEVSASAKVFLVPLELRTADGARPEPIGFYLTPVQAEHLHAALGLALAKADDGLDGAYWPVPPAALAALGYGGR
ncbi:hypothetical protein ACN20G_09690 [Streptomyces sp. BI20]|uniref:hypothetical protein n=1 Tax=Streptomyces sp. BI20 TaxID=3403460 RepID=UPI003C7449F2